MKGFWSSFECINDWKRRLIFIALLIAGAGMLWQTNNLISENPNHPVISPEASLLNLRYDEYGDPIAVSERTRPLPYAKVWSSPLTQICLAFVLAIVIGSLFRSLIRGSLALVAVTSMAALLVGRENLFEMLQSRDNSEVLQGASTWLTAQTDVVRHFFANSLPSTLAAATGLFMGLKK